LPATGRAATEWHGAILYEPRIPSSRSAFVNCAGEQLLLIALARALL
jgi:hypothetical protein